MPDCNDTADFEKKNAELHLKRLGRVLQLDHEIMGGIAIACIKEAIDYWRARYTQADDVPWKPLKRGYKPRVVTLHGSTFAQLMAEKKWIIMPMLCHSQETLPSCTINRPSEFPARDFRTLPAFGKMFGFHDVEDTDGRDGKNILHYLFSSVNYSCVAAEVALRAFQKGAAVLPGDYKKAMSHKVRNSKPDGWTPLHCLCHCSDKMLAKKDIIGALLTSGIVTVSDFDSCGNNEVIVFGSLGWAPSTPSEAAPLRSPSFPTYVRTYLHICMYV